MEDRPTNTVRYVDVDDAQGQRIDNFLLRLLTGVPRSRVYRLLRKGEVRVNGGRVKATYRLRQADRGELSDSRSTPPFAGRVTTTALSSGACARPSSLGATSDA